MLHYTFKKKKVMTQECMTRQRKMRLFHLFDFIPSLGVLCVACLAMGGHISLLASRPVWYAASSAAAGSPAPSPDSDLKP